MMRRADAQRQPPTGGRVHRQVPAAQARSDAAPAAVRPRCRVRCAWCECPSAPPWSARRSRPGTCGIHAVSRPASSAHSTSASILATLRAMSPRSAPIITPVALLGHPSRRSSSRHLATSLQRRAGREHRGGTGVEQLLHVGLRDGAADDHGDVAGVGSPQRVDGARGQGDVRTGQDAKARRRRRPPAARSRRCPRCAAGCRCRSPRSRRRAACGRRSWRRGRDRRGRAWRPRCGPLRAGRHVAHQNTTGCWNSPQTALSAETISPTVQYALAQSIRACIRLSFPRRRGTAPRAWLPRRPVAFGLDPGQPLELQVAALGVELVGVDVRRRLVGRRTC